MTWSFAGIAFVPLMVERPFASGIVMVMPAGLMVGSFAGIAAVVNSMTMVWPNGVALSARIEGPMSSAKCAPAGSGADEVKVTSWPCAEMLPATLTLVVKLLTIIEPATEA